MNERPEHRVRVSRAPYTPCGEASAIRPVVPTVTLREALAVLDEALAYADDRMAASTKRKIRTELAGRLERDARR